MAGIQIIVPLMLVLCIVSGQVPVQQTQDLTTEQLYKAMEHLVIKNIQLEMSSKSLQNQNGILTNEMSKLVLKNLRLEGSQKTCLNNVVNLRSQVSQVNVQMETKENMTLVCEAKLNDTLNAKAQDMAKCRDQKEKLNKELSQCEILKSGIDKNQIRLHHLLNVSYSQEAKCKAELAQRRHQTTVKPSLYPTCKAWMEAGYTSDGNYTIDPDGMGGVDSFEVECVMNSKYGEPMTIMHHDSEARMDAGHHSSSYSYVIERNVSYVASIPQISAVINVSLNCEQFIKIDCYESVLTGTDTWYSRDGTPMYYWGGATPGSGKCACGMTDKCDKPGTVCNCDANYNAWRSDSGLLTDRSTLPVTKMAFGDLQDDFPGGEFAFHTLGPLKCYG